MAKINLNPMFRGISGKFGNVILRSTAYGTVISACPAPKNTRAISPAQQAQRQRFKQAAASAKAALADPETRARYEAAAARVRKTAYNLALADFMKQGEHHDDQVTIIDRSTANQE